MAGKVTLQTKKNYLLELENYLQEKLGILSTVVEEIVCIKRRVESTYHAEYPFVYVEIPKKVLGLIPVRGTTVLKIGALTDTKIRVWAIREFFADEADQEVLQSLFCDFVSSQNGAVDVDITVIW